MMDETEQFWSDLVVNLKKQMIALGAEDSTKTHNRIWETVSAAFHRGQTEPRKP